MALARQSLEYGLGVPTTPPRPKPRPEWHRALHWPGPAMMHVGYRTVDGSRVRYAESEGPQERTILLTSPCAESLYSFAPIWPSLARRFRLLAIDIPGFGASEPRPDLQSPREMGAFLTRLIDELDLGRPHIVAPDVGTPAALFAAAGSPDLVASVVVGGSAAAVPLDLGAPLQGWLLDPDPERDRAVDSRAVINLALDAIPGHAFTSEIREDYLRSYAGDRCLESMRYVRRLADELPVLAERLQLVRAPVLIFSGLRDRMVPPSNAEFLADRLPHSRLAMIGAGHFVWEEAPDAFSEMISAWVTEGHRELVQG